MRKIWNPVVLLLTVVCCFILFSNSLLVKLTLSWRRSLSYKNQSTNLKGRSMDWFLYDRDLRHERAKYMLIYLFHLLKFIIISSSWYLSEIFLFWIENVLWRSFVLASLLSTFYRKLTIGYFCNFCIFLLFSSVEIITKCVTFIMQLQRTQTLKNVCYIQIEALQDIIFRMRLDYFVS